MGNQLDRDHEVGPIVATGGPDGIWKIYSAKRKDTGEPLSVWVFEKKVLEKQPRDVQDAVLAMLRADVANLSKLVHPNVIRVLQPLTETRALLIMQTEPIFASLANVLKDYTGLPKVPLALDNVDLDPLEIKLGILEVAEGLSFLHGHARIVHRNLSPESIFITQKGMWKLGGLAFCLFLSSRQSNDTLRMDYHEFDHKPPFRVSPNLDYMAYEAAHCGRWDSASDMYSLGLVAWQLHLHRPPPNTRNNLLTHRNVVERIQHTDLSQIPESLQASLRSLLSADPHARPEVQAFLNSPYFKDTTLLSLVFLNDLITKDDASKIKFFKGLSSVLPRFSSRLVKEKVLPALISELSRSVGEIQGLILQSVLAASRGCLSTAEFSRLVLPALLPLITPEAPPSYVLLLLGELETLVKLAPAEDITNYLVPLVTRSLESPNPKLNEEALKQLPKVISSFDVTVVREAVIPRLELLMTNTRLEPIRARILIALKDVVQIVDKPTTIERVLPIVDTCVAADRSPASLMRCMVMYDLVSEKAGMELTAARILPFVTPLLLEPQLDPQQLGFIIARIKAMLDRVAQIRLSQRNAPKETPLPEAVQTQNAEADFEAVVASEGAKKAVDRTRSHNSQATPTTSPSITAANQPGYDLYSNSVLLQQPPPPLGRRETPPAASLPLPSPLPKFVPAASPSLTPPHSLLPTPISPVTASTQGLHTGSAAERGATTVMAVRQTPSSRSASTTPSGQGPLSNFQASAEASSALPFSFPAPPRNVSHASSPPPLPTSIAEASASSSSSVPSIIPSLPPPQAAAPKPVHLHLNTAQMGSKPKSVVGISTQSNAGVRPPIDNSTSLL